MRLILYIQIEIFISITDTVRPITFTHSHSLSLYRSMNSIPRLPLDIQITITMTGQNMSDCMSTFVLFPQNKKQKSLFNYQNVIVVVSYIKQDKIIISFANL